MRLHLLSDINSVSIVDENNSLFLSGIKRINTISRDIEIWHITTFDDKNTVLSEDGMFYFRFSCEDYSFVERLSVEYGLFIAQKGNKYGLFTDVNYYESTCCDIAPKIKWILECNYSVIKPLKSNLFYKTGKVREDCGGERLFKEFALLAITEEGQHLIYPFAEDYKSSTIYDKILDYPQPTKYIVVKKGNKFGLIDRMNGNEVVSPTFISIEKLPFILHPTYYKRNIYNRKKEIKLVSDIKGGYYDLNGILISRLRSVIDIHENECIFAIEDFNGKKSVINRYGFFYNFFDCRELDFVSSMYNDNTYIYRKNDKYGIIDDKQKIIIEAKYKNIEQLALNNHLKISVDSGFFIMDLEKERKSLVYDDIEYTKGTYIVKKENLYGFLNKEFVEVVEPKYEKDPIAQIDLNTFKDYYPYLLCKINERRVPICPNSKYYGLFETDYEECYCLGDHFGTKYFAVKSKGVYGIAKVKKYEREYSWIYEPYFDEVYFYDEPLYKNPYINFNFKKEEYRTLFVGKINGICGLYEIYQNNCFLSDFDTIEILENPRYKYSPYFVARTKGNIFYFDAYGIQISKEDTHPIRRERGQEWEQPTYMDYVGSYAQDEMGYSDDDIDTIFDGDPDAYWNID